MSTNEPIIVARNLRRQYRVQKNALRTGRFGLGLFRREMDHINAVDGIDFTVEPGTAAGLIGLNGAGKSTLMKMITGVLVPSSGHLTVGGLEPASNRKELAKRVGVVFGHRTQLWWDVPLADSIDVLRRIYRVDRREFTTRLARLTELLELGDLLPRAPRQLSLGQRVRAEIVASLLHGPALLVLDEPTVGLDILAKASIRSLLRTLIEEEGVTLLLASHEVNDIEQICDRVILIDHGKILFDGGIDELKSATNVDRSLELEVLHEDAGQADGVRVENVTVKLDSKNLAEEFSRATATGTIASATVTGGSLEAILASVFRRMAD